MHSEKISHEDFIKKAIVSLRKDGHKGIHNILSGFDSAFRKYYSGTDPNIITDRFALEGKVIKKTVNRGYMLYLTEDYSSGDEIQINGEAISYEHIIPQKIISEFIQALDQEINAIKRGKGGSSVKVINGRFLRVVQGLNVYLFNLENFLVAMDETPAEIEIKGNKYKAQILSTRGLEVEIGIEYNCGEYVAEAVLLTNLWYLLELLKKKYIESQNNLTGDDFKLSNTLFSGGIKKNKADLKSELSYSKSADPPNPAQKKAIEASFYSPLSIIWGPPGTGKTKTIAKAVEAHLNAGRRILLASHANNAVDEALKDIAEHLKATSFYQDGKLVRLGKPQEEQLRELENNFELVLLDKIAEKRGESLAAEKNNLENEKRQIEGVLTDLVEIFEADRGIADLLYDLKELKSSLSEMLMKPDNLKKDISQLELNQSELNNKLREAKSAGAVKKFFKGLNPDKIQQQIDQLSINIDSKRRQLKELESGLIKVETEIKTRKEELDNAKEKGKDVIDRYLARLPEVIIECPKCKTLNSIEEYSADFKWSCADCESDLFGEANRTYFVGTLKDKKKEHEKRRDEILSRVAEINSQLEEIQKKILSEAKLVATTLTKTFSAKQFPEKSFDVLVVDEASMAPLPHLYWATSRCSKLVTIVGDFLQLPPICISDDVMAQKWLNKSIFSLLNIKTVDGAHADSRVQLLNTQYRMAPEISAIPNRFFYQNKLRDHPSTRMLSEFDDGLSAFPLVLINTSKVNPWCSRLPSVGRFNLYNALLSATLAKKIIENSPDIRIGIVAPYAAQARLINKIAHDWQLLNYVRISTVHRFQGGEEPVIILDTVEGPGTRVAPMLDDTKYDSDARLVLNVAMTRCQKRFYLIGHTVHLLSDLPHDSILARIVQYFFENAEEINSESLVDNYFTTDFDTWANKLLSNTNTPRKPISGELYTENNFYAQFLTDLKNAREKIIILSPFISIRRSTQYIDFFRAMSDKGIEICIFTKPLYEQKGNMADQAESVMEQLQDIGVKVIQRAKMHQKVAIVDNMLAWEGSLNILSHRDTGETMRRFECQTAIDQLIKNLELEDESGAGNIVAEKCPKCGSAMIMRKGKYGKFMSCLKYPKCKGSVNLRNSHLSQSEKLCPECGRKNGNSQRS